VNTIYDLSTSFNLASLVYTGTVNNATVTDGHVIAQFTTNGIVTFNYTMVSDHYALRFRLLIITTGNPTFEMKIIVDGVSII
jgi:hypothetical protein